MDRRMGRGYARRDRHLRRTSGGRRPRNGSPLVWIASAGVLVLLSFWAGLVIQLARLPRENDDEKRPVEVVPQEYRGGVRGMGEGGGRISPPSEGGGGGGDAAGRDEVNVDQGVRQPPPLQAPPPLPSIQTPRERPSTATGKKPELLKSVYHSVDYKGGDILGVGPLNVEDEKECRSLCVRDGRCLKWTLQLKEMICWLKDAGGTRNEGVPGLRSGLVRVEEDATIPKPRYGKEPPPPPVQCCPDAAAEPPAGVHALDLWDDEPGSDWTTSYALGNGYLGAMLGMGTFKDTMFMSHGSLWTGKGKLKAGGATSGFPLSPDRYDKFRSARESLLDGDVHTAQEAAGRMPTSPEGFVGSFEYAGELHLEFGEGGGQQVGGEREEGPVDGYIRHLHLNNGTAEATFSSKGLPASGGFGLGLGLGFGASRGQRELRLVHRREAFASNVDGVLAMRLSCKEEEGGRGCLSLVATPKRQGKSHFTEAGRLPPPPPPRVQLHENGGAGGDTAGWGAGAYVGLYRPSGRNDEKAEMGFHVCVAVFPSVGEGSGVVTEEYVDPSSPRQRHRPEVPAGHKETADGKLMMARLADAPGGPPARNAGMMARLAEGPAGGGAAQGNAGQAPPTRNPTPRHRIALSATEASSEAMVLVSVVTEEKTRDDDGDDGTEGLRRRCLARVEAAAGLGFEELRRRHVEDVDGLFDRVHFSLGPSGAGGGSAPGGERRLDGGDNGVGGEESLSPSRSCVAGLPIRTRVARSGKACTQEGGEGAGITGQGPDNGGGRGLAERTVVDDGLVELMYHYGRYLMISGSRPGGRPLNLQGIWANSLQAKWEGDYHMNINLQMNYWGAHTAGLPECAAPLVPFVEALSDGGRQTAHSYYRAGGWVSHANTDRWGGTAAHGDAVWALCPTCGAWMALHLWEAYEYTRDVSLLLASVVPVLEGAVLFFLEYMVLADDGLGDGTCLLTGPSTSPENSLPAVKNVLQNRPPPAAAEGKDRRALAAKSGKAVPKPKPPPELLFPFVAMSPAIDVSIVRQLLENFVDASREAAVWLALLNTASSSSPDLLSDWATEHAPRLFNPKGPWREEELLVKPTDNPVRSTFLAVSERLRRLSERSQEALSKLPNRGHPSVGRDGMIREYRGVDTSDLPDPGHRHFSGLWGLYPGFQISPSQGEDAFDAAATTVQYKISNAGGHTAWSRTWLANLQARLFQGTEALASLRGVLRDQCVGSLFSLHPALSRIRGKDFEECSSCYELREEENRRLSKKKEEGLVTADGAAFQIDGNLGFLAGVNEMLLQSQYRHSGSSSEQGPLSPSDTVDVRLLPALPDEWPAGTFRGLRTRGGYEVDVVWNGGEISAASLRLVESTSAAAGAGNGDKSHGRPLDVKPPRLRVLSRTQLTAVLVLLDVDGNEVIGRNEAGFPSNERGVLEGGIYWYSVSMESLRMGEEARFFAAGP